MCAAAVWFVGKRGRHRTAPSRGKARRALEITTARHVAARSGILWPVPWRHKMCSRPRPMKQADGWAVSKVARVAACTHACATPKLGGFRLATPVQARPKGAGSARCHGSPPRPCSKENMLCGDTEFTPPSRFRVGCETPRSVYISESGIQPF